MQKKINSVYKVSNSLASLLYNLLVGENINKEEVFYSLFGVIVLDFIINKDNMVKNTEGIKYESLMSDNQLEDILKYLDFENIDKDNNGASIYATIRNKFAHGDYFLDGDNLIFKINDKRCRVNLKHFVCYYVKLTQKLDCRYKDTKYKKYSLINKSIGKIDKIIETDNDIDNFLKLLNYKEYIFKRLDGKELSTKDKDMFTFILYSLYKSDIDEKTFTKTLSSIFNNKKYCLNINTHKIIKMKDKFYKEIKTIISKYNNIYDNNVEYINNILFQSAEDIYKLCTSDYEHEAFKYGFANLKVMLNDMIEKEIYDIDEYVQIKNKEDYAFNVGLPIYEMVISIVISLIYFDYCYPLEKIFKKDKTFNIDNEDFDFNNLNLSELNPSINKLYDLGKDNVLNESFVRKEALNKKNIKYLEDIEKIKIQKNNVENKLLLEIDENKKRNLNDVITKLQDKLDMLILSYENNNKLYLEENNNFNNLRNMFEGTNLNFYNYSIISGIRNSIAHGNVRFKNLYTNDLKDIEIEFLDIYENDLKFKLNIKLYNLFALIEADNLNVTNNFFVKKLNKQ